MDRECKHPQCANKTQRGVHRINNITGVSHYFDYCGQYTCPAFTDRIKADSKRIWK